MKTEWRYPFDDSGLNYLSSKAKQINDIAARLGVPAPGLAGGIAREMTLQQQEYPKDPLWRAAQPFKGFLTSIGPDESGPALGADGFVPWTPMTHGTIAGYFARSNTKPRDTLANPSYLDRWLNPLFFDVGPGNIKIRTAISMLQNYNRMFPDSDPLDLKRYNDHYDVLVRDLKNADSDTTISEDQKAAALTKYYAVGKERMEDDYLKQGGVPGTYTPDFNGDGSDMYLHDPGDGTAPNPARLKDALSPPVEKQDKLDMPPGRRSDSGPGANNGTPSELATAQPDAASSVPVQTDSSLLPPQVVATGNYLRANGIAITPRTVYMAHVIGPERTVDVIRRTGSTFSPDVPSADAATGDQVRAWVRALRGVPPAGPAGNGGSAQTDDATVQPSMPAPTPAPPAAPGAFPASDGAADTSAAASIWPQ